MKTGLLAALPPPPPGKTGWPWTEETPPDERAYGVTGPGGLPKITIVTPSYNQGPYIEETIRSVVLQNYPNLEYIIIDGGSTDGTVEIIRQYAPWITAWVSEPDRGQTDAINKGFGRSTGDIFNWLNSDDYYAKGALFAVAAAFAGCPAAEVLCGREWTFEADDPARGRIHEGTSIAGSVEETLYWGHIDQPATFFRRLPLHDCLPLSVELKYLMDAELWMRYLLRKGQEQIVRTEAVLVNFRLHPASKTVSQLPGFDRERNTLLHSLAAAARLPGFLVNRLLEQGVVRYNGHWPETGGIDTHKLAALYAKTAASAFYNRSQYEHCLASVKLCLQYGGRNCLDREFVWVAAVTRLLPLKLLRYLKKKKYHLTTSKSF